MILTPLFLGGTLLLVCTAVQSAMTVAIIRYFPILNDRISGLNHFLHWTLMLEFVALILILSFLLQTSLWAVVFVLLGETADFQSALYFSLVNYTTLGYGDILPTKSWRLLGPIEGINGVLMGGFSASILFTVASWVQKSRISEQELESPSRTSKSKADDLHKRPGASR